MTTKSSRAVDMPTAPGVYLVAARGIGGADGEPEFRDGSLWVILKSVDGWVEYMSVRRLCKQFGGAR